MNFKRSARVGELLRHEISQLVQEIKDPRFGFVTITGLRLSDDLMEAKVFFSVFGEEAERKISSEILLESVPSMRQQLGRKLESLRRVPNLNFIYDETPERAQKVASLLNQLAQEREQLETGGDTPTSPSGTAPFLKGIGRGAGAGSRALSQRSSTRAKRVVSFRTEPLKSPARNKRNKSLEKKKHS